MISNLVSIKAQDDKSFTIGGYGVVFGGKDLAGDRFVAETDFWLDSTSETPPLLFDHWMYDESTRGIVMGKAARKQKDDIGIWFEAQLDKGTDYAEMIMRLIEEGILGYSTGSAPHVVERIGNTIKTWPILELSLTPTPMDPRTIGVEAKSWAMSIPLIGEKAAVPNMGDGGGIVIHDSTVNIVRGSNGIITLNDDDPDPAGPTGNPAGPTGDDQRRDAVLATISEVKTDLNL